MSVVNAGLMLSAPSGYTIDRSLRFRSSASAYLNWTPSSAGDRRTWTFSLWTKLGYNSSTQRVFGCHLSANDLFGCYITTGGQLVVWSNIASAASLRWNSNALLRDYSAWYHLVFVLDTTQATSTDRFKVYLNNEQLTTSSYTAPAQNSQQHWNNTNAMWIGKSQYAGNFDGYLTEVNFIDGQALDPTDFGEYNADTGVWQAKKYVGTYGTNGFYLNFSDNSSTTTLGEDGSGNGNDWTLNNFSLTSGSTYDSMTDVPTLTSETQGNYATLNPLDNKATISDGNLKITYASASWKGARATIPIPKTGKWKWEVTPTQMVYGFLAVAMPSANVDSGGYTATYVYSWYLDSGEVRYSNSNVATGKTVSAGDVCEVRVDDGEVSFYKNNVLQHTFTQLLTDISNDYFPACWIQSGAIHQYNFGQRPFVYTPTGFKALNTYNLPDSTVADGSKYFDVLLHTGNGGSLSVTGLEFQPDFVWSKARNTASYHRLHDVVRGSDNTLATNVTDAEVLGNGIVSFDADGFTLDSGSNINQVYNYVDWVWKANGSGVSNTDGSITSTVSANTTAGFSIVTWAGQSAQGSIGLGLSNVGMIISKRRNEGTADWPVLHQSLSTDYGLFFNKTNAQFTLANSWVDYSTFGSSVLTLRSGSTMNQPGTNHLAYCFAEVEGFSKIGKYTGNGSTTGDGTFVYTGFRPAWVLIKQSSISGNNWVIYDAVRDTYNECDSVLYPNAANAEFSGTTVNLDLLSNGFKARDNWGAINTSGETYIYMAFAENPFKNSLAR